MNERHQARSRIVIMFVLAAMVLSLSGRTSAYVPPEKAVKFTVAGTESAPTNGACSAVGYTNICYGGNCECIEVPKAIINGDLVSNCAQAFISVDKGLALSPNGCEPAFASIISQNNGANCGKFFGTLNLILTTCATGYSGGWDIANSDSGSGTFTGTVTAKSKLSLKFQGGMLP